MLDAIRECRRCGDQIPIVQNVLEDFQGAAVPVEHGPFQARLLDELQGALVRESAVEDDRFPPARSDLEKPGEDLSLERLLDSGLVVEAHLSQGYTGGQVFVNKGQGLIDLFCFDLPGMVPDGRVDIAGVLMGQRENRPIRIDRHPHANNGHNPRRSGLGNGIL